MILILILTLTLYLLAENSDKTPQMVKDFLRILCIAVFCVYILRFILGMSFFLI